MRLPALSLSMVALLLASCASSSGTKVDQTTVSQFVKGKTTYRQVTEKLGSPNQSTINSNGTKTIAYSYAHAQSDAKMFIPIVGPLLGGINAESTVASFTFDKNSILTDHSVSETSLNPHPGLPK